MGSAASCRKDDRNKEAASSPSAARSPRVCTLQRMHMPTPKSPLNYQQVVDSIGTYGRLPSDQEEPQVPAAHERQESKPVPSLPPYLILSIDSGGLRGVFAIRLLRKLEEAYPGFLDHIHLVAGTSSGGVIALALAAGIDLQYVEDMYLHSSQQLFKTSIAGAFDNLTGRFTGCPYSSHDRLKLFTDAFARSPAVHLRDLKKCVFIPSVRLKPLPLDPSLPADDVTMQIANHQWGAQFFHNFLHSPDHDGDASVIDVAMRTTAAPTFYPIFQGYVDGGMVACNPSVPALAQVLTSGAVSGYHSVKFGCCRLAQVRRATPSIRRTRPSLIGAC